MSERARVALIFTAVAALAGGGIFYFFKIHRPAQVRQEARAEIEGWEQRWKAARACLLGPTPGSSKTAEALAIREMAPDPWDRGRCTPLISKLSRGDAPDTGLAAVEDAWVELDHAAAKAASAFATHVGSSTTVRDPLPAALDALDAAHAALRTAAELPAADQPGKPLPEATILHLADGNTQLATLEVDAVPSAHGLITYGKTADRYVQIDLVPGGAPVISRVAPSLIRSVTDQTFGASITTEALRAGAVDVEGVLATPIQIPLTTANVLAAVTGTLADGRLVYGSENQLVIARTTASAITPEPPVEIASGYGATDLDGRVAVVWNAIEKTTGASRASTHARLLPSDERVDLPRTAIASPCMTRDRVWVLGTNALFGFGGAAPVTTRELDESATLVGCTADAALLRMHRHRDHITICTDRCRAVVLPSTVPTSAALTVVGGKVVAMASHGGVLGVWREDTPPIFYAVPEDASPILAHEWPAMALTDGKVIDVIARGASTFVVIRIPAT